MDKELEDAIQDIGRDRVFSVARANGWPPGSTPPKWVWWVIISELRKKIPPEPGQFGGIIIPPQD